MSEPGELRLEHVFKSFRGRRATVQALDDVSLDVGQGEFVCIVGPSGCGKSTLLDIIAGLSGRTKARCWPTVCRSTEPGGTGW